MARILLVDDDPERSRRLELALTQSNWNVFNSDLDEEAISLADLYDYDIIILSAESLDDSDIDPEEVLRQIRSHRISSPVIVVSNNANSETAVRFLSLGCDYFIKSPYSNEEVLAHLSAALRRQGGSQGSIINAGSLAVDLRKKTVSVDGRQVVLTGREYEILEILILRKGSVVAKEMFVDHLYGDIDQPELKIIDVFIAKLRKKLSMVSDDEFIQTIWGRGYLLHDPSGKRIEGKRQKNMFSA